MSEFWRNHFDKVLLASLFVIAFGIYILFVRELAFYATTNNAQHLGEVVNWLQNTIGQLLAALLALMVGRSMASRATDNPGGGPAQPKAPAGAAPVFSPAQSGTAALDARSPAE